jgi:hypothetical protein
MNPSGANASGYLKDNQAVSAWLNLTRMPLKGSIVYRFLGTKSHKSIGIKGIFNDNNAMSESSLTYP